MPLVLPPLDQPLRNVQHCSASSLLYIVEHPCTLAGPDNYKEIRFGIKNELALKNLVLFTVTSF